MNGAYLITILLVLSVVGLLLIIRSIRQSKDIKSPNFKMPRLAVLDDTRIDRDRRLVLVRRDNVEHLLLIGGGSDVVIEQYAVGSEIYGAVANFKDRIGNKQIGAAEEVANQLQLAEETTGGSHTNEQKLVTSAKQNEAAADSAETAELPPIIDDLVKSPMGSAENESSTGPKINEMTSNKQLSRDVSPNDSETQAESAAATASEDEKDKRVANSSQPVDEQAEPPTEKRKLKWTLTKKKTASKEGYGMLEKLQERQTREPVPSTRVPNFISEIEEVNPFENQALATAAGKTTNNASTTKQPAKKISTSSAKFPGTLPESDEEVFDKIGKEMTKILEELKRDDNSPDEVPARVDSDEEDDNYRI